MFSVYAIYNEKSGIIYIGQTRNLEKRLREHNSKKGNHFTARVDGIWRVVYKEEAVSRNQALTRERELKSYRGREFLKKYIPR